MIKGLYTAYTGMVNEQKRLDVLTNNLANADTNGYKKEGTTSQTFADELAIKIKDTSSYGLNKKLGVISMGVHLGETYTNYDQGSIKVTDKRQMWHWLEMDFLQLLLRIKQGNFCEVYKRWSFYREYRGLSGDKGWRLCVESGGCTEYRSECKNRLNPNAKITIDE